MKLKNKQEREDFTSGYHRLYDKERVKKEFEPKTETDNINHPAHYTDGKIEVIDFIEDKKLPYHLGNVIKYISRAGKKNPDTELEDLKKAQWYLNRYIELKEETDK